MKNVKKHEIPETNDGLPLAPSTLKHADIGCLVFIDHEEKAILEYVLDKNGRDSSDIEWLVRFCRTLTKRYRIVDDATREMMVYPSADESEGTDSVRDYV